MAKAILIREGDRKPEVVEFHGLKDMQALLGGYVEGLRILGRDDVHGWGNEEAKLLSRRVCSGCGRDATESGRCPRCGSADFHRAEGLAENVLATELVYGDKAEARRAAEQMKAHYEEMGVTVIDAGPYDPREPFIAGPVLLTGITPEGDTADVPEDVVRHLCG